MQQLLVKYYRGVRLFHLTSTEASSTKVEELLFHLASTEVSSTKVHGHSFPGQAPKKKNLLHLTSTEASSTKV
jgi:hypothetical protein